MACPTGVSCPISTVIKHFRGMATQTVLGAKWARAWTPLISESPLSSGMCPPCWKLLLLSIGICCSFFSSASSISRALLRLTLGGSSYSLSSSWIIFQSQNRIQQLFQVSQVDRACFVWQTHKFTPWVNSCCVDWNHKQVTYKVELCTILSQPWFKTLVFVHRCSLWFGSCSLLLNGIVSVELVHPAETTTTKSLTPDK